MSDDKNLFNKDLLRDLEDPEFLSKFIVHSKRMSKNRGHDSVCPARDNVAIDANTCTHCWTIYTARINERVNIISQIDEELWDDDLEGDTTRWNSALTAVMEMVEDREGQFDDE